MTQLTIDLPDITYQALKTEAQIKKETINEIVVTYLSFANTSLISPVQRNWLSGFFDKTSGCLADMPLERDEQGESEQRLDLL